MGRPSSFTTEMGDAICERLADGESLRTICSDDDMPTRSVVFRWLATFPTFQDQYAHARDAQADALADDIVAIVDEPGDPQRARVRMDARKWVAAKLKPKKYGDQMRTELTGEGGGALQIAISMTPKESTE